MDKFFSGAITRPAEKRKRARPSAAGASSSHHPSSPGHNSDVDLMKSIVPGSRKCKEPNEVDNTPRKTNTEEACTSIQQPSAFATHKDSSFQSSYLLSIFPGNEADRWGGDSKLRAKFCMKHLAELNSGLACFLHEAIAGEAPSSAEHHKVKKAYDAEAIKTKALETELKAAKVEMVRQAGKIKSLELAVARHQQEVVTLRSELEIAVQEAVTKEAAARQETRENFLSSPYGARFLKAYREELLTLYHDSMPFLAQLCPAAKQYLFIGATRALEQAQATGKLDGYSEAELILNLPDPDGWAGDSNLPLDHPWWEPALENTVQSLEKAEQAANAENYVDEERADKDAADTNAELGNEAARTEEGDHAKQAVQLEIEQLRGKLNVAKHMGDEGDLEVLNKVETLLKEMREKERELQELDFLNQTLIVHDRKINEELQDARKEMINALKELAINSHISVKRMGELDDKPFHRAMKRRYNEAEADERAAELCSLWEDYLRDPEWHPIKVVNINNKYQSVIDESDERLKDLKENYGEEVCNAVITALKEVNEYNPSGRYVISEMWNYNDDRRASLKEGVEVLLNKLRFYKRKRGMN